MNSKGKKHFKAMLTHINNIDERDCYASPMEDINNALKHYKLWINADKKLLLAQQVTPADLARIINEAYKNYSQFEHFHVNSKNYSDEKYAYEHENCKECISNGDEEIKKFIDVIYEINNRLYLNDKEINN